MASPTDTRRGRFLYPPVYTEFTRTSYPGCEQANRPGVLSGRGVNHEEIDRTMLDHSHNHREAKRAPLGEKPPALSFKEVNWRRLFGYLTPYRGRMALAILALLVSTASGLAFPALIVRLLDSVTQAHDYGPLNMMAGAAGRHLSGAGCLQLPAVLSADLHRRTHRLRSAHVVVQPAADTCRSSFTASGGWATWCRGCPAT